MSGVDEYQVRWKGFEADHDTWEPKANLHPDLIADYERSLESPLSGYEEARLRNIPCIVLYSFVISVHLHCSRSAFTCTVLHCRNIERNQAYLKSLLASESMASISTSQVHET